MRTPLLTHVAALGPGGGGPPPTPPTGALSTDLGLTWAYAQDAPSWVLSLLAPSSVYPLIVLNWQASSLWVQDVTSGLDTDPLLVNDPDWSTWDPTTTVVPGSGLNLNAVDGNFTIQTLYFGQFTAAGFTMLSLIPDATQGNVLVEFDWFEHTFTDFYDTKFETEQFNTNQIHGTVDSPSDTNTGFQSPQFVPLGVAANYGYVTMAMSLQQAAVFTAPSVAPAVGPDTIGALTAGGAAPAVYCSLMAFYAIQPDTDLPAIAGLA